VATSPEAFCNDVLDSIVELAHVPVVYFPNSREVGCNITGNNIEAISCIKGTEFHYIYATNISLNSYNIFLRKLNSWEDVNPDDNALWTHNSCKDLEKTPWCTTKIQNSISFFNKPKTFLDFFEFVSAASPIAVIFGFLKIFILEYELAHRGLQ